MVDALIPTVSDRIKTMTEYSLMDVISCEVTKSESGEYTLKMTYPINGASADMLLLYNRINCITSRADTLTQPFVITKIEQNINGILTVTANHQTYLLSWYPVRAFEKASRTPSEAVSSLGNHAVRSPATDFLFVAAEESAEKKDFGFDRPTTMREAFYGSGGLLDVYGGCIIASGRTLKWTQEQTVVIPKGVIRYGVNLQKFRRSFDASDTYSHAYVYWKNGDEMVQASELVQLTSETDFTAATTIDLSNEFSTAPTAAQLTAKAQELAVQRKLTSPEISLDISFVPLRLTDEYKHMTWLEEVDLFDIVTVEVPMYGASTTARITKTQFDVLSENYKKISVGNLSRSLDRTIARLI